MLLSRSALNVNLIEELLKSNDPRVRANAIESTWQLHDLLPLIRSATSDPHNRVVGNALFALYKLGDTSATAAIIQMAKHHSVAFQLTALWVMGETEDHFGRSPRRKTDGSAGGRCDRSRG
ncbi:MAG: HEAT repeat domain-containing protein [Bryobacteraceae bacterium]